MNHIPASDRLYYCGMWLCVERARVSKRQQAVEKIRTHDVEKTVGRGERNTQSIATQEIGTQTLALMVTATTAGESVPSS